MLQRQQLGAARLHALQADMQLVQYCAVLVIEYSQHQLIVVLLQPRTVHVGQEAGFLVDTRRMASARRRRSSNRRQRGRSVRWNGRRVTGAACSCSR